MIKRLLNFFKKGSGESELNESDNSDSVLNDVVLFVDYVVRSIVDIPSEVKVVLADGDKCKIIKVRCHISDVGKVIGKNGKTIMAIRLLVNSAGNRLGHHINVEVEEGVEV